MKEDEPPPLRLHGERTEPSALLKVQANVHGVGGIDVSVQPMIDSGASGMGFVDPAFVQRCGVQLRPSSRRITLADGSEVRAAGEATLSYSLVARSCHQKESTPPVRFTSTFIVTPLAPYEMILGVGWLEQHHALIGFRERSIQLRVDGAGKQRCIRPLARCNDDGSITAEAAPLQLKAITQRRVCKLMRQGQIEQLYAVIMKPVANEGKPASDTTAVPGSDHPLIKPLLGEFGSSVFGEPKAGVPRKRGVEHAIQLMPGTVPPPARPLRHQSEKDAAVMREYVDAGLKAGTLRPSTSPYGSMALIVMKKDGSPRVVIDYRALNEVTVKNKYPLPLMDELFDRTQGARCFTSIDLRNGFHQIAIR
ncbi:reverse transcriptase family protein, partial [Dyella sp.]|uniref:reverse transcriptase family protein n=1 Tax=Dyella sp. TaxID=1869338 RepID=UPI00284B47B3